MGESNIYSDIISRLFDKKYSTKEISSILPKIKLFCDKFNIDGEELRQTIDLLIEIKRMNRLEMVNSESLNFIEYLYNFQLMNGMPILTYYEITKHILIPYNLNKCDDESRVYSYQAKIELLMSILEGIVASGNNFEMFLTLSKYNKELYDIALLQGKIGFKLENNRMLDPLTISTVSHLFGVFYINQDKYKKDSSILEDIVDNIISNPEKFKEYCEQVGIVTNPRIKEDLNLIYLGINELLDASFEKKKEDKREK